MPSLGKKLFLIFLILSLFSLLMVGLFINYSIGERFDDFINLQREESINELILMLKENINDSSLSSTFDILNNFSRTNRIPIWLEDAEGNLVYSPNQSSQMNSMMRRMGMRMGGNGSMPMMNFQNPSALPGETKKAEISVDNETAGYLYWKEISSANQIDSELYNYFRRNVFQAIIFSALIVIILITIISFIISRIITNPLIKLKNAALEVADGSYNNDKIRNISQNTYKYQDELGELIEAFNEMTNKLTKLEKIRKESASDLAHELRTPVTTIKGYLEAIEDEVISLNKENIEEMKEETERIVSLIEKLKEFAEAQNKIFNLKKEDLEVNKILKNVVKRKEDEIDEKSIEVEFELADNSVLKADEDSLYQIFNNLIENAVKYNKENGKIYIKSKKEDNYLTVTITDTGIGISEKDLPYIFERFYRADKSRNSKNGGTGIGLAVAKELLEAHQAEIYVESDKNGTSFRVLFTL